MARIIGEDEPELRTLPSDPNLHQFELSYADLPMELRELSLVRYNRITHEGIQALVRGCPAIEKLNLTKCCNITDESVPQILLHLRRLRDLNLSGCQNVTNSILDYIACHGHRLRILHLRGCYQIDVETTDRFASMPQLTIRYR